VDGARRRDECAAKESSRCAAQCLRNRAENCAEMPHAERCLSVNGVWIGEGALSLFVVEGSEALFIKMEG